MFCSNCGNKLEEGQVFCTNCGWKKEVVEQVNIPPQMNAQTPNNQILGNQVMGNQVPSYQAPVNQMSNNQVPNNNQVSNNNQVPNNQNKPVKKKKKHGCLIAFLIFALIIGILIFAIYRLTSNKNKDLDDLFTRDYAYLTQGQSGEYTIKDAPQDISFYLSTGASYTVTDENGNIIDTTFKDNEVKYTKGYEKGKTYSITVNNGSFLSEDLVDTKSVKFTIGRDEVVDYSFSDKTDFVGKRDVSVSNDGKTLTTSKKYDAGSVIIVGDKKNIENAYYVEGVNGNSYNIRPAALNEIYGELDVYYKQEVDLSNGELSDSVKKYVLDEFKKSEWYSSLVENAYAAAKVKVDIKDVGNTTTFTISLTLPLGDVSEYFSGKKHEITFTFTFKLTIEQLVDISLTNYDVAFCITEVASIDFSISNKVVNYSEMFATEPSRYVLEEIRSKVDGSWDDSKNTVPLTTITIPSQIPGLTFKIKINLEQIFKFTIEVKYKYEVTNSYVIGFAADSNGNLESKFGEAKETKGGSITIAGSAEYRVGIAVSAGVDFINTLSLNLEVGAGFYIKANLSTSYSDNDGFTFSESNEMGLYLRFDIKGKVVFIDYDKKIYDGTYKISDNKYDKKFFEPKKEGEEESTGNNNDETVELADVLERYSCVQYSENSREYTKYKFDFDKGSFNKIRFETVLDVNTGVDIFDKFIKLYVRGMVLYYDITYHTYGVYEENGTLVKVYIDVPKDMVNQELDVPEDFDFSNYYAIKSAMMERGFTCK